MSAMLQRRAPALWFIRWVGPKRGVRGILAHMVSSRYCIRRGQPAAAYQHSPLEIPATRRRTAMRMGIGILTWRCPPPALRRETVTTVPPI